MSSDARFISAILFVLLLLAAAAGVGALAWTGSRDLMLARVVEAEVEAQVDAVTSEQAAVAARLAQEPDVDGDELDRLRAELEAVETPEAKIAAASRLAAALSRALAQRPTPATEAEQQAYTTLKFEVIRAQERVLALQEDVAGARARTEEAEQSVGGRIAKGLGVGR